MIVATDLNAPMLARAEQAGTRRPVQWREADAMALPFADASFDMVACQFGVMFFPDKGRAFAEARRVLVPGGTLIFNVWDQLEFNAFARDVTGALATLFPDAPPEFMVRVPHGYHSQATIEQDLRLGGFRSSPVLKPSRQPAAPAPPASRRWHSARARRCAPTWSGAGRMRSARQPTIANRRSWRLTARVHWPVRCRRTW